MLNTELISAVCCLLSAVDFLSSKFATSTCARSRACLPAFVICWGRRRGARQWL